MTTDRYSDQVRLLMEVLPHVAAQPCFALKGGTAINFFHRDLPRLSVDLDLTYLPVEDRDTSLANIHKALTLVASDIEQSMPGASVQPRRLGGTDYRIALLVRRRETQVKVEVNATIRGSVHPPRRLEAANRVRSQFGEAAMLTLAFEELYAGKLCAALDRQHPRDLFDVKGLLDHEGLGSELKDTFLVYLLSHRRPMAELLAPTEADIKRLFSEEFVGMSLNKVALDDLLQARSTLVTEIHARLTDTDREFLLSVKGGDPDWAQFAYPEARHLPAVRWKLHNLARMTRARRAEAMKKLERALAG